MTSRSEPAATPNEPVITHPEKVLFPDDGITKGELVAYYADVAELMLPHVRGRPVTLERFPAGIGRKGFIQKDVSKGFPAWLERVEVPKKDGTVWYPLANDARALRWMANQNSITPHVWSSRLPELDYPDLCVIDLDPAHEDAEALKQAALAVRALLDELSLPSWIKTSGSKGFHIVVPLDGTTSFDQVARFAHGVGSVLVKRHPDALTQEFIKLDRAGRILIDTGRNGFGATFAAPYAVRPKPLAPVSAPCTWDEVERGEVAPQSFNLRNLRKRIDEAGELWGDLYARSVSLSPALEKLRTLISDAEFSAGAAASRRKGLSKKRRAQRSED
ncbi:MAG: non-homologous end-joining DNA ligase [Myxococcota bacterium]